MDNLLLYLGLVIGSIVFWAVLYIFASPRYEKLEFGDLPKSEKNEILKFLHDSYLSKLSMYHEALIGCLFGLFVTFTLLTQTSLSVQIRLCALWLGVTLTCLAELILAFTMVYYGTLQICEESYKIDSTENSSLFEYSKEIHKKSLNVLDHIPVLNKREVSPKLIVGILALSWFIFLLPALFLMLMLY